MNRKHMAEANLSRRQLLKGSMAASLLSGAGAIGLTACGGSDGTWRPKRTVIVILENKSFSELIDSKDGSGNVLMPYLNQLASASALLTKSYAAPTPYGFVPTGGVPIATDPANLATTTWTKGPAFVHPLAARGSQTNYFYQFAGHNQGFLPDWFLQPGSGRMLGSTAPYNVAFQDQYGNLLVDGNGLPKPSFSGEIGLSNELVTSFPNVNLPFTTPNLGAAIMGAGFSFATFSESLPYPSYNEKAAAAVSNGQADGYARRHNPAINWINFSAYGKTVAADKLRFTLPVSSNLAMANTTDPDGTKYPGFGVDKNGQAVSFDQLPTVSLVVPDNQSNIHTGTKAACDAWLSKYIKPFADWAAQNDGLLIVTTDEDGFTDASNGVANVGMDGLIAKAYGGKGSYMYGVDNITTLFFGPTNRIKPGRVDTKVDHLNVLATVLQMYGVLDGFKNDFQTAWSAAVHPINSKWVGGADSVRQKELVAQLANLTPISSVAG